MGAVILVEIQVTSPAGAPGVLRFSDRAIRPFPPTDPDRPNVGFDSRIVEQPTVRRALFDNLATMKPSLGVGVLTLANSDGELDAYEGYVWGEMAVLRWTEGTDFADATVILAGLCAPPSYPRPAGQVRRVTVSLYDYAAEASKPLQPAAYAGSNGVGGVLYEGTADGLKGRPKPLAFGNLLDAHLPAPQVNPGVRAHQLHDGPIEGAEQVFDRGDAAGLVDDGDFAGAAFDGVNPAAAKYRTDIGRGLLKMNAAPVGQVTFGCKGDKTGGTYVETAGPILARLLARSGVAGGRIGASVAGLAGAAVVGFYADETTTLGEALAFVAAGVPAAVLPDRTGVWQALAYGPPKLVADATLTEHQVIACTADEAAPLPVGEIRVGWGRVWRTFSGTELAPALAATTSAERLAAEYRFAVVEDATVKARLPGTWQTVEIPTALRAEADALALANALKALLGLRPDGKPRRAWRVTVEIERALASTLGETIAFDFPPYGLSGNFLLVGEELCSPRRDQAVWTLWG